ncbi:MAG: hypothetical protein MdMp014T_1152 [Treponematales bacterium]
MDRAGLIDKIFRCVTDIYQGREWLDTEGREGDGRKSYNSGLSSAFDVFKKVCAEAAAELETLVLVEKAFLFQELQFCVNIDEQAANSLKNAIESFDAGLFALKAVEAGSSYCIVDQCLPRRKETRHEGMPKDSFHYACTGHIKRLDSILHSPGINLTEKTVLKQRLSNIVAAQAVYVEKQKKALGIVA